MKDIILTNHQANSLLSHFVDNPCEFGCEENVSTLKTLYRAMNPKMHIDVHASNFNYYIEINEKI